MSTSRITVLITGANRGLGLAMIQELTSSSSPTNQPLTIIACARKPPSGSPVESTPDANITWQTLDTTSSSSISDLFNYIKTNHSSGIDILINNAGVNLDCDPSAPENEKFKRAKTTIDVNYKGTIAMTTTFLPLLKKHGHESLQSKSRIVNVSSVASKIKSAPYSSSVAHAIKNASTLSQVNELAGSYLTSVESNSEKQNGWPVGKNYCVSKALINAASTALAKENEGSALINFCCPGWCNSDMGSLTGKPPKTTREGARIPLHLAFGNLNGTTGKYFENDDISDTGVGEVREW